MWQTLVVFEKEEAMKRLALVLSLLAVLFVVAGAWALDKTAISNNVDTIVAGIESGQKITAFKVDAYNPYAFIMEENGNMLVHPTLVGKSLKEVAPPVYEALMHASAEGAWVQYEWKGKEKNTYAKKTKSNLIVGSGY
jgi:hypothetical protein